jgi:hypothetical protein
MNQDEHYRLIRQKPSVNFVCSGSQKFFCLEWIASTGMGYDTDM